MDTRQLIFNLRGEVVRDETGLIVTNYLTDTAFTNAIAGFPDLFQNAPPTTYEAITARVTLKPAILNTKDDKISIRPEVRYDRSLNGTRPYDDLTKKDQFLFSTDFIIAFRQPAPAEKTLPAWSSQAISEIGRCRCCPATGRARENDIA